MLTSHPSLWRADNAPSKHVFCRGEGVKLKSVQIYIFIVTHIGIFTGPNRCFLWCTVVHKSTKNVHSRHISPSVCLFAYTIVQYRWYDYIWTRCLQYVLYVKWSYVHCWEWFRIFDSILKVRDSLLQFNVKPPGRPQPTCFVLSYFIHTLR